MNKEILYSSTLPLHRCRCTVAVATGNGGVKAPLLTTMLGTFMPRGMAWRRREMRIAARSRAIPDAKFCGREIFRKFRSEIR